MRHAQVPAFDEPRITVKEWTSGSSPDGFDPRSAYVERYWLGILGPATTVLVRHFAAALDRSPHGTVIDVSDTARSLGLKASSRNSSFQRSLARACLFGIATAPHSGLFLMRRMLPKVNPSLLSRLPSGLQDGHLKEVQRTPRAEIRDVEQLARLLLRVGREFAEIDADLARWGVPATLRSTALYQLWDSAPETSVVAGQ